MDTVVQTEQTNRTGWADALSGVSWASIVAGGFVAAAVSLALLALGAGLGLASVSPWSGVPSGSTFTNIANLATNNGSFTLKDGQSFTTVGAFTNAGSLTVDATGGADSFTAGTTFSQTAGTTTLLRSPLPASTDNPSSSRADRAGD